MFAKRLKAARAKKGFTQKELGDKISMTESTVSLYETGRREPSLETIRKIAFVLCVTSDYLLGLTEAPTDEELNDDTLRLALLNEFQDMDNNRKLRIIGHAKYVNTENRNK
jgi:transcriptional regulator with XRE-family HTH domain